MSNTIVILLNIDCLCLIDQLRVVFMTRTMQVYQYSSPPPPLYSALPIKGHPSYQARFIHRDNKILQHCPLNCPLFQNAEGVAVWCLTPLGWSQFYWWRKPERLSTRGKSLTDRKSLTYFIT